MGKDVCIGRPAIGLSAICLSDHRSVQPPVQLSVRLSVCPSIHLSVQPLVCLPVGPPVGAAVVDAVLALCLSVRLSVRPVVDAVLPLCQSLIDNEDAEPGEEMQCLIKHKHHADMNQKCSAGIMHHQLVST